MSHEINFRSLLEKIIKSFVVKLQVNLSSVFTLLIAIFAISGGVFTYFADKAQLLNLSSTILEESSILMTRTLSDIVDKTQILAKNTRSILKSDSEISANNQKIVSFLYQAVGSNPLIGSISFAGRNGQYLSVLNLYNEGIENYFFNPEKPLPPNSALALRYIIPSGPKRGEYWDYKNINQGFVDREVLRDLEFNPKDFDWFNYILQWPHPKWFTNTTKDGHRKISLCLPLLSNSGSVIGVMKVDWALYQISNLIEMQRIGRLGRVFILDSQGKIILPRTSLDFQADEMSEYTENKFQDFIKLQKNPLYFEEGSNKYLIKYSPFNLGYDLTWYVAIILPFHDIFGNFISIEYIKNWISVALVALFGVFIYFSSKKIAKPIVLLAKNVDKIRNFEFDNPFPVTSRISEIITLSSSLSSMRSALKSFSKYLPKEIVKSLVRQGHDISTGGERRDLTILFSDIENFTTISESLKIEELTIYLSQYFGVFSKIINGTSGTVDKFIGDAMMAFWNAPEAVLDQGDKACISALKFFKHIQDFKTENPLFRAKTRFGIHSGETIVGNIGTEDRMNYTVIGNVVNTTSRLEGLNKVYGTHILISETTHEKIGLRFLTRPIDFIVVKGRTQGITIYELLGTNDIEPEIKASEKQKQLCELFSVAFQLYHAGKMEEAKSEFLKIFQLFPQDQPTLMYLSRLGVNTTSLAHE